ncbi:MAG: DUF2064 domain-containing protein [Verrucomicrobiaceae bacterium]|nr:DUF2064 domain-containing protein [Verrucomicrobiaceae bacterium]
MSRTTIVVFTRLPRAGEAKTRMIPVLGAEGAARLQEPMTRHIVGRVWSHAAATGGRLVVAATGCTPREMRSWLGPVEVVPQGDGDLGDRLSRVIEGEFRRGAGKVIVVGADCPRLHEGHLVEAEEALEQSDLVFGPAQDGGYYLVGLNRPLRSLFENIAWGTGDVLTQSLAAASLMGIVPVKIETLSDVDEPEDLDAGLSALEEGRSVSVIIPALNESENLKRLLPLLLQESPGEIIVVDGGSDDDTVSVAESLGAQVIRAERGRASQMNVGAHAAVGEFLLFLHADTTPPEGWALLVAETLIRPGVPSGAFSFALSEPVRGKRIMESLVALRCRVFGTPYGDQGLFVRRRLFLALGGFPEWPILEDVEIVKQLGKLGKVVVTEEKALTSARRWRTKGVLRTFLAHQAILVGYTLGLKREMFTKLREP